MMRLMGFSSGLDFGEETGYRLVFATWPPFSLSNQYIYTMYKTNLVERGELWSSVFSQPLSVTVLKQYNSVDLLTWPDHFLVHFYTSGETSVHGSQGVKTQQVQHQIYPDRQHKNSCPG